VQIQRKFDPLPILLVSTLPGRRDATIARVAEILDLERNLIAACCQIGGSQKAPTPIGGGGDEVAGHRRERLARLLDRAGDAPVKLHLQRIEAGEGATALILRNK